MGDNMENKPSAKPSATARFAHLEIGHDHQEFESTEQAKLHVAKQLENLAGLKGDSESRQEIVDELAKKYDFTPPPMDRELLLRELRARQWEEEDRKIAARRRGENPTPKWNGVDAQDRIFVPGVNPPVLPPVPDRPSFLSRLKRLLKKKR